MKKKKNRHKIYIETVGQPQFPRYRIVHKKLGYWDGAGWQNDLLKGLLYYWFEEVALVVKNIQMVENIGKPMKTYTATVTIEVMGDKSIDKQELIEYLAKEARLLLDSPSPNGSVVHAQIDWGTLKEKGDEPINDARSDAQGRDTGNIK